MKYLVLMSALLLAGCHKPSIYLYGKYISEQEAQQLSEEFEHAGYNVELNSLPFPQGISNTSILSSPLLKKRTDLEKAVAILKKQGLEVDAISSLVEGSHFVTKNALAVFVVSNQNVFAEPVKNGQIYTASNCDAEFEIHINTSYGAIVKGLNKEVNVSWQLAANQEIFQLTKSNGANLNYDIHQSVSNTPVGIVDEIRLKPILANTWFGDCEFYYGLVRTAP